MGQVSRLWHCLSRTGRPASPEPRVYRELEPILPLFAALAAAGALISREGVLFRPENKQTGRGAAEKLCGTHWSGKGGGTRPRRELGPRSRWSPLIPVLPRGPGCRAPLRDPPRKSDVNNRSGVTKLALSLANWATRLAEVSGIRMFSSNKPCSRTRNRKSASPTARV